KGQTQFEMSAGGVLIRKLSQIRPYSGKDISLSIDANLSKVASDALHNRPGAVVVTDAKNGQVLVLVSTPGMNRDDYSANLHNEDKPLLNRAVLGYAPGSTFKLITAIAGLENGTIDAASKFNDKGEIKVGEQTFRNWYFRTNGKTEGEINVARALTRSTDTFFYDLANKVGPEKIQGYAKRFHLGILTGIELPEETSGLIPTPAWKERTIGSKWFTGDTFNMGIGQGYVLATPLQINMMTAAIANGGQWCAPTLLLGKGKQCEDTAVTTSTLETVLDGMVGACSHGGTGVPFFAVNDSLPAENKVACKTGTAELGVSDSNGKKKTHAWFTMVYPRENPKVAITVFLESGGSAQFLEGSSDAAPIAKTVWDAWRVKYDH
ncbi:MAG TPA: penicillin-binding transpeptidase domain-containing protein, partial [Patescibacteria group bacterium]|nr:penicillin-binding transpeptidase domain-containing protein [Patescibacteria group bacterium]